MSTPCYINANSNFVPIMEKTTNTWKETQFPWGGKTTKSFNTNQLKPIILRKMEHIFTQQHCVITTQKSICLHQKLLFLKLVYSPWIQSNNKQILTWTKVKRNCIFTIRRPHSKMLTLFRDKWKCWSHKLRADIRAGSIGISLHFLPADHEHSSKANTLSSNHHFLEHGFQVCTGWRLSHIPGPPFLPPSPDLSWLRVSTSTRLIPCSLNGLLTHVSHIWQWSQQPQPQRLFLPFHLQCNKPCFFNLYIQTFLHTLPLRVIPTDKKKKKPIFSCL